MQHRLLHGKYNAATLFVTSFILNRRSLQANLNEMNNSNIVDFFHWFSNVTNFMRERVHNSFLNDTMTSVFSFEK